MPRNDSGSGTGVGGRWAANPPVHTAVAVVLTSTHFVEHETTHEPEVEGSHTLNSAPRSTAVAHAAYPDAIAADFQVDASLFVEFFQAGVEIG